MMVPAAQPELSVCITTRNRAAYLGQTLRSILEQCTSEVEVVVVDGASSDDTLKVLHGLAAEFSALRVLEQAENSGLDADYDKSVLAARGRYCWLFSDDDLLVPGAVAQVLKWCAEGPDVLVVDASVHGPRFEQTYERGRLPFSGVRRYGPADSEAFFRDCAGHITFIGAVVVRRSFWIERERARYFGTEFVHCGVLFQSALPRLAIATAEPLVRIRYGLGNWTDRQFDVWMRKWPELIWSFDWIDEASRRQVCVREPWRNPKTLMFLRALGRYGHDEYAKFVVPRTSAWLERAVPLCVAKCPGRLAYAATRLALRLRVPGSSMHLSLDTSPFRWPKRASHSTGG